MKKISKCIYYAFKDTIAHDGEEYAGYLAFIILLSIFPFLVFLTTLAATVTNFLNQYDIDKRLLSFITENMPSDMMSSLMPRINEIVSGPPQNLLTLAIIGAIWTASSAVEGIRGILNKVYRVSSPPSYILRRLLSIIQFLIITLIIIITIMCATLIPILEDFFNWKISSYIRFIIVEFVLFITVCWLYFLLPNVKQKFINVIPGSIMVIILWTLSAIAFTKYLQTFHQLSIIYGSLAGIIISLLFFYVLSFIFIYGAEFNYKFKYCNSVQKDIK
ncbi:YihY/virulence factor BrkB family protein [Candidatus Mesenet endosymbiont of Phosphuga atrata]|uniref:YihY/virulence factor BrkB family protein n=1 Tax=Candidatus Mesenet endosymbiont of Phosphuga atrata TaxID=3066221 RepID=UPI0030D5D2D4